jgi:hypothetical protein
MHFTAVRWGSRGLDMWSHTCWPDHVGNAKPDEGEILESPGQVAVGSWVTN